MKTVETWGVGYLAEGARGSTGPVGEERERLYAARPEMMKKLQAGFARGAAILATESDPAPSQETTEA